MKKTYIRVLTALTDFVFSTCNKTLTEGKMDGNTGGDTSQTKSAHKLPLRGLC